MVVKGNNYLECEDKVDVNVEACQESYGKIRNFICENSFEQHYKLASYVEL
jgi:hypothetical protein